MNLFSGWFLAPQFVIETEFSEEFQSRFRGNVNGISVFVMSEIYFNANITQFQFCSAFMGALKPKNLYPLNNGGKEFFFILPKDEPKKLSHKQPGKAHVASHMGTLLSLSLVQFGNRFELPGHFFVTFSNDIISAIEGEQHEFLIGLLQKSISNKVSKQSVKNGKKKQWTVTLQESIFSKDILSRAQALSDAMCYTRTFINMPPNVLNPESYEMYLRSLVKYECEKASQPNHIQIEVFDYDKLHNEGCGLICAVGQGSQVKPRLIKLTYSTKKSLNNTQHVSLVGKGITFDTGGYDIKPSSGMRIMKKDMGGSAAALGIFFACARMGLPMRLTCWLPLAENMISGNAMRPGDVFKARNGLQIEIDNTDAEGRLVLADAISLACEELPDWLIDLATLTGAARVSLGTMIDSMYGNAEETSQLLYHSGIESGDWVWNMPLPADYDSYFDSSISDFANGSSSGFGGSITAALFLQKFVSVSNWNHIDTYMWCDKPVGLWSEGGGATGKCVRLVTRAIERFIST